MRILLIDHNLDPEAFGSRELRRSFQSSGVETLVRRAPEQDLPSNPHAFDAIVLSGSKMSCLSKEEWVLNEISLIQEWIRRKTPLLGICFGHQIIARAIGGEEGLGPAREREWGFIDIERVGESRLLKGLPEIFPSFSNHFEEVKNLPEGFLSTSKSPISTHQSFEALKDPVFGVQFHPEVKSIKSKEKHSRYSPEVVKTIFSNFFAISLGR